MVEDADCGVRCAEKTESGGVHNFILTKFQYKFLFFMSKYVFQIQYGVWMKKSILKFFNKLLFPTLSIWIVQFTVHAYDTAN